MRRIGAAALALALALAASGPALACGAPQPAPAAPSDPQQATLAVAITGDVFVHEVARGEHLTAIGARYGTSVEELARANGVSPRAPLRVGQRLEVDNRHLAPAGLDDGVLINLPQRMLFHFEAGRLLGAWPVAVGRPDWPTPTGSFRVASLARDKPWIVPKSIQEEMRREGKPVLTRVEPGPDNPLGKHWIGLSIPALGIHGTIAPSSIFGLRSHGCIRMHPDDVATLFDRLRIGEPGVLIYRTMLLARLPDGRIFVEVHRDAYRRSPPSVEALRALADREGLSAIIDWERVRDAVAAQDGIAREVGLGAPPAPASTRDR